MMSVIRPARPTSLAKASMLTTIPYSSKNLFGDLLTVFLLTQELEPLQTRGNSS